MNSKLENWFSNVYEENFDAIFNYILKRTSNLSLAQDLTSETFYKVVRHIKEKGTNIENIKSWLYKIAINEIRQNYRKNKRLFFFSSEKFNEIPVYETPASEVKAFEKEKEKKAELAQVMEIIKEFPLLDQEIVTLRFLEGKKTSEIAKILGKKESAIRVRLHRLKGKLKKVLDKL